MNILNREQQANMNANFAEFPKTNRRQFLQTLGVATAAAAVPFHVRASVPSGSALPIVGEGVGDEPAGGVVELDVVRP